MESATNPYAAFGNLAPRWTATPVEQEQDRDTPDDSTPDDSTPDDSTPVDPQSDRGDTGVPITIEPSSNVEDTPESLELEFAAILAEEENNDGALLDTPSDLQRGCRNTEPRHKECLVCLNECARNRFPKPHTQSEGEQHGCDVCFDCYDEHIEAEIDNKGAELVSCPQCPQTLTEPEIRQLTQRLNIYQK
jgi:hypothetical protein